MRSQAFICLISLAGLIACDSDQKYSGGSSKGNTSAPVSAQGSEVSSSDAAGTPVSNEIAPLEAPKTVVTPTPVTPGMTPVQVAEQVVKNSKLPEARKGPMATSVENVIVASQTGDQDKISSASGQLLGVALGQAFSGGNVPAFGLVDAAALRKAIEDLVAAAMDADLDGIKKAVEDIVAAAM